MSRDSVTEVGVWVRNPPCSTGRSGCVNSCSVSFWLISSYRSLTCFLMNYVHEGISQDGRDVRDLVPKRWPPLEREVSCKSLRTCKNQQCWPSLPRWPYIVYLRHLRRIVGCYVSWGVVSQLVGVVQLSRYQLFETRYIGVMCSTWKRGEGRKELE